MRGTIGKLRTLAAMACMVATVACGGGGDDALRITYGPPSIRAYIPVWELNTLLHVTASVSPRPTTTTYVDIVDSGNVIATASAIIYENPDGTFTAQLPLRASLTPATYTGTLTVHLCKDAACASPYELIGASLPYTITITPQVTTTASADIKIDGVTQTGTGGSTDVHGVRTYSVSMATASIIDVQTSVPIVSWGFLGGPSTPTVVFTSVGTSNIGARLSLSVPSDITETTTLRALAADGQMFYVNVTVTH